MTGRRELLSAAVILAAPKSSAPASEAPAEDLMQEHGLLNRLLLIYEECIRRMEAGQGAPAQLVPAGTLVRDFVERYHEGTEEEFVFPRMRKTHGELVETLLAQHQAGRRITAQILAGTADAKALRAFVRMYRPHESREDTVLFPAFRDALTRSESDRLGEKFEGREKALFGERGFERQVEKVAQLERALGLYDLAQFTP